MAITQFVDKYIPKWFVKTNKSIVISLLFLSFSIHGSYAQDHSIFINGQKVQERLLSRNNSNDLYIPVEDYCKTAKIRYAIDDEWNILHMYYGENTFSIYPLKGSSKEIYTYLNNRYIDVEAPINRHTSTLLIPIRHVSEILGVQIDIAEPSIEKSKTTKIPSPREKQVSTDKRKVVRTGTVHQKAKSSHSQKSSDKNTNHSLKTKSRIAPKTFGIQTNLNSFKPNINEISVSEKWCLGHSVKYRVNNDFSLKLRFDSFENSNNAIYLPEQGVSSINMNSYTGYVLYTIPKSNWHYNVGFGIGLYEFKLNVDSAVLNNPYYRSFGFGAYELKLGAEYQLTRHNSLEFEIRAIFAKETIEMNAINSRLNVSLDGIFYGFGHIFYF